MTIEDRDGLGFIDGEVVYGSFIQSLYKASIGHGVISKVLPNTKLKVSEKGTPDMGVSVAIGSCYIDSVIYEESSATNLSISNGDASNPRIDLIVYHQSTSAPIVVEGTPASSPKVPDVTDDDDVLLGLVYVDTGESTAIYNADITDVRAFISSEIITSTTASDTERVINSTEQTQTTIASYTKAKETLIDRNISNYRVKFRIKHSTGSTSTYARYYINGAARGTEQSTTSSTYVTKTEDISNAVHPGDLVQIYLKVSAGTAYVDNFGLYYDDDDTGDYTNQDP